MEVVNLEAREIPHSLTCKLQTKSALKWKINDDDPRLQYIEKAGFGWVRKLECFNLDIELIRYLYSRFRKRTSTFCLGNKKYYMITLEDVIYLTGLNIDGKAIVWKENKEVEKLCSEYLGREPGNDDRQGTAIHMKWLLGNFKDLPDNPSDERIQFSARAYLLYIIGRVVFPDLTGKTVPSIYLTFLKDFEEARKFSWGSAILVNLIKSLEKEPRKKDNVYLAGNAVLLQFWAYERFPMFRPNTTDGHSMGRSVPLMVGWSRKIAKQSINAHRTSRLDAFITTGDEVDIVYSSIDGASFPTELSFLEDQLPLKNIETQLIHGSEYLLYRPPVCPHQFEGLFSETTSTPLLPSALKVKTRTKRRKGPQNDLDWEDQLSSPLNVWDRRWALVTSTSSRRLTFNDQVEVSFESVRDVAPHEDVLNEARVPRAARWELNQIASELQKKLPTLKEDEVSETFRVPLSELEQNLLNDETVVTEEDVARAEGNLSKELASERIRAEEDGDDKEKSSLKELGTLKMESANYKEDVDKLKNQISEQQGVINSKEAEVSKLKIEILNFQKENKSLSMKCSSLEEQNTAYQQRCKELEQMLCRFNEVVSGVISKLPLRY